MPNPYQPALAAASATARNKPKPRRWAMFGFLFVCSVFVALGAFGLYTDAQYAATLPPGTPRCGNGELAAMLMIFPISPALGFVGAGVGYVAAIVYRAATGAGDNDSLTQTDR